MPVNCSQVEKESTWGKQNCAALRSIQKAYIDVLMPRDERVNFTK